MDKFTSDLSNYKAVIDEMKQNSSSKEYEEFQANIFYNACLDEVWTTYLIENNLLGGSLPSSVYR